MAAPTPLFGGQHVQPDAPLESEEVLVINALLQSGQFAPEAVGLSEDMAFGWTQAWRWCQEYQDREGVAPPVGLFARTFPTFEVVADVGLGWAADKLKKAHYVRTMRRNLQEAIRAMNLDDLEKAREVMLSVAQPQLGAPVKGVNAMDPDSVASYSHAPGWRTPWQSLTQITGGGRPGEFWLVGARLGQGKSFLCPLYGVIAAEIGARVRILSAEMPAGQYLTRVHDHQARGESLKDLRRALHSPDEQMRRAAVSSLPPIPGTIEVLDPSHIRMDVNGIRRAAEGVDMLIVDHVGLMSDDKGKRAIEDWRVMAVISNTIKEVTLQHNIWVMGAVQINRSGESGNFRIPKVSEISQSDSLGQDADVVMLHRRMGVTAMHHEAAKVRNGPQGRLYTRFDVPNADFTEITSDQAKAIEQNENELAAQRG